MASPVVVSPLVPCFPDRLGKTEATKGQSATKGQYLLSTYRPLVAPRGVILFDGGMRMERPFLKIKRNGNTIFEKSGKRERFF